MKQLIKILLIVILPPYAIFWGYYSLENFWVLVWSFTGLMALVAFYSRMKEMNFDFLNEDEEK